MKKHIISILVLFLMVSTSLVGVSNQVTDDLLTVQQDSYQYTMDWSVHLTNQSTGEVTQWNQCTVTWNQETWNRVCWVVQWIPHGLCLDMI